MADFKKGDFVVEIGSDGPAMPVTKIQRQDRRVTRGNYSHQYETISRAHLNTRKANGSTGAYLLTEIEHASEAAIEAWREDKRQSVAKMDAMIDAGQTLVGFTPSMMIASRNSIAQQIGISERKAWAV